jgi:hypothetical protein
MPGETADSIWLIDSQYARPRCGHRGAPIEVLSSFDLPATPEMEPRTGGRRGRVLHRHSTAGGEALRLLTRLPRFLRFAGVVRADGAQSRRVRGPAPGASPCVAAIPAHVEASAAAIGHHLVGRQANAAHPARPDRGRFPLERGRRLPICDHLLASKPRYPLGGLRARRRAARRRLRSVSQPFLR